MSKAYQEYRKQVEAEQSGKSYEQIKQEMQRTNEFTVELDNLPKQTHRWIDRGEKFTCENAGHPYHEAWQLKGAKM